MPIVASLCAIFLSLLPVAVVVALRARRGRALWALALDIPLAVALDLLVVLVLCRLTRLEIATFVSRGVWIAGGAAALLWRRRAGDPPARPSALGRWELQLAGAGALVGLTLSALVSRPYSIWDRKFHTPLVSSLRGQRLPFENAIGKGEVLHYHFAGDVHAAMIQSFSLGTLHSSAALSLAHDVIFTLMGASIVLLFTGLAGRRGAFAGLAVTVATMLAGPLTLGRDPAHPLVGGYSVINFLSISFRPHDALAALFYVGFIGAVLARVWRRPDAEGAEGDGPPLADTAPALLFAAAGLSISDEASLGLMGLSLGLTWLAWPGVVHPRRGPGVLIFVGLLVAFLGPNLAFAATISPGAQRHAARLVAPRSPGCYTPTLQLATALGARMLVFDVLPVVTTLLGGVAAFAWRPRPRSAPILAFYCLLTAFSLFALTCVDVNHDALESHRFVTCIQFLAPLLGVILLLGDPDEAAAAAPATRAAQLRRDAPAALVGLGAALGVASTISWLAGVLPHTGAKHDHFFTNADLYALDCRKDFGATLGATARPLYISKGIWYAYAGCQPTFAPGKNENRWAVRIGNPYFERAALPVLDGLLAPDDPLTVVCPRVIPKADRVCGWAVAHARCEDLGAEATRCTLDAAERAAIPRDEPTRKGKAAPED